MKNKIEEFKEFVKEQLEDFDEFREAPIENFVNNIAEEAVKLFTTPAVKEHFSNLDKISQQKIESEYSVEDLQSDDENLQGEITIAKIYYEQGIMDVLKTL